MTQTSPISHSCLNSMADFQSRSQTVARRKFGNAQQRCVPFSLSVVNETYDAVLWLQDDSAQPADGSASSSPSFIGRLSSAVTVAAAGPCEHTRHNLSPVPIDYTTDRLRPQMFTRSSALLLLLLLLRSVGRTASRARCTEVKRDRRTRGTPGPVATPSQSVSQSFRHWPIGSE